MIFILRYNLDGLHHCLTHLSKKKYVSNIPGLHWASTALLALRTASYISLWFGVNLPLTGNEQVMSDV